MILMILWQTLWGQECLCLRLLLSWDGRTGNGRTPFRLRYKFSQFLLPLSPQLAFLLGSLSIVSKFTNNQVDEDARTNRLPVYRSLI
jgi:hypothetical protein